MGKAVTTQPCNIEDNIHVFQRISLLSLSGLIIMGEASSLVFEWKSLFLCRSMIMIDICMSVVLYSYLFETVI